MSVYRRKKDNLTLKNKKVRFVDAAAISSDEAQRYWEENYPLVVPWGLPESEELVMELKRQGYRLDRPYFAIIEEEE
jgi:hypothetical protein